METPTPETSPQQEQTQPATPITTPESELIDIDYFSKVKFRVGVVVSAEMVAKSKKLIKLQVDLGPTLGKKQILSGIAKHYTPESMIGKRVVVVANLKPASLMGELSEGMLLAASNEDDSALCVLEPTESIQAGAEVR